MYPGGIAVKLKSWGTGKPTSNIYEALPPETRISEYIPTPEVAKKMASIRRWAWLTDKTPASLFAPGVLLALACWLGFTHARRRTWETPVGIIILLGLACIWVFLD